PGTNASGSTADDIWTACVDSRFPTSAQGAGPLVDAPVHTATLDLEIKKIEACLLLSKKRRNMIAACSRVPAECLLKIFTFTRDIWPPSRVDTEESERYDGGWMAVTDVCRNVTYDLQFALLTPSLWADLSCTALNLSSMNELLRRSKLTPLSLRFDVSSKSDPSKLSLWLQGAHTQRLEALYINRLSSTTTADLLSGKACVAFVETSPAGFFLEEDESYIPTTFPPHILFAHIQKLRLALVGADSDTVIFPTPQQLTEMLSALNAPRIIELINIFPIQGSFSDEVTLPESLQRLVLSTVRGNQARSCSQLWSRLVIPRNTSIIVDIRRFEEDILEPLRETFAHPNSGFQSHPVEVLVGRRSHLLLGSETYENPCTTPPNRILDDSIKTHAINSLNVGPNQLFNLHPSIYSTSTFQQSLNYDSTRVLHFTRGSLQDRNDESHWLEALSGAQAVQRVVLPIGDPSRPLLYAMARTGNSSNAGGSFSLFPLLRVLTLHYEHGYVKETELLVVINVLIYVIHVRRECGSPIEALQVSSSMRGNSAWDSVAVEVPIIWF
ncbi:hypothetical protein PENSPDRAFT_672636, partial [Peniophora sp. CONT]